MALTRPNPGDTVDALTFGQPVYDLIVPTAWVNVTPQNSWVHYSVNCSYRKIGDTVYMRGTLNGGVKDTTMFTLPVGFRPAANLNIIAYHWPNTPSSCFVMISTAGTAQCNMLDSKTGNPTYVSFDQVWFSTV